MKTLEEKKLLVKMARMLGEPVDPELIESIKREEQLTEALFGKKKDEPPVIVEVAPEPTPEPVEQIDEFVSAAVPPQEEQPAETGVQHLNVPDPEEGSKVAQTAKYLDKLQKMPASKFKDAEMEAIRKTVAELLNRVNTLSFGGGGTGIVRIFDADDFDRTSIENDKQFVTWRNGYFQLDYINPNEIVANTTYVTSNTYQITNDDYYIGVNVASTVTLTLPPAADIYTGREFYVKDESGNAGSPKRWIDIYPSGSDKIDGQNYVRLQIDYGGLKFIYRNGWRVI